jgi:hypothetical protein
MSTLTSHRIPTTSVDRALLRAASALDRFVASRLERRAASVPSAAAEMHDSSRATAQAVRAIGILPR